MNREPDTMPSQVMWWGIGLLVGGAVLVLFAPAVLNTLMTPDTTAWQSAYQLLDAVLGVLRVTLPPLGAALIAASLVMRYLDRRLGLLGMSDRPKRWVFPRNGA